MFIRWGDANFKWGEPDITWGADLIPFQRSVRLLDAQGRAIAFLDNFAPECTWTFNRMGGCGSGSVTVIKEFEDLYDIRANYRLEIYINGESDFSLYKIYTGVIVDKELSVEAPSRIALRTAGFSSQLNHVLVGSFDPYEKTKMPINEIVADIYNTYIASKTDILFNAGYVDVPTYIPDRVYFDGAKAFDAFSYLAQITGEDYEFGVDKDLYLYFRAKSTTTQHFWFSRGVNKYREIESYENIKNRVLVKNTYYKDTFERVSDYGIIAAQTAEVNTVDCGTSARQKIKQTFHAGNRSISRIAAKMVAGGGVGWTDRITDGNMEAADVASWGARGTGTTVNKSTVEKYKDTQSLLVETALPGKGTFQALTGLPNGTYTLFFAHKIIKGDLRVLAVDSTGAELAKSDRLTRKEFGGKWFEGSISFTVSGSPTYVEIRAYNDIIWSSKFHLDEFHCYKHQARLKAYLADDLNSLTPIPGSKEITFPIIELGGEVYFDFHYFGCDNDAISTYAIVLEPEGPVDDATYFQFKYAAAGAMPGGGTLYYYDGSTWGSMSGTLTIQIYYNQSQEEYRLREEVAPSLPNDIDVIRQWTSSYLSGLDRSQKRANFSLVSMRSVIDTAVPAAGVGMVSFRDEGGAAFPSQPLYDAAESFRTTNDRYLFAQPFSYNHDFTVLSILLRLKKVGSPTGSLYLSIYEDDGGQPDSVATAISDPFDVASLGTSEASKTIIFLTFPTFRKNALYWWQASGSYSPNASNYITFAKNTAASGAGIYISNAGVIVRLKQDFTYTINGLDAYEAKDIVSANYSITENGMNIDINAGSQLPDMAKLLKRIEHEIESRTNNLLY